jgi:hypothetical protein
VPVACVDRAIVQAARDLPQDSLHQVVADAVRTGRTTIERIRGTLNISATRRATRGEVLRSILDGGVSYSVSERALVQLLRAAHLHGFVPNWSGGDRSHRPPNSLSYFHMWK